MIKNSHQLGKIAILAGVFSISLFLFIKGLSYTSAIMGTLIGTLGLFFTIGLVGLVFSDERRIIKDKSFIIGSMFVILGVIGLNLSKGIVMSEYSLGIYYLLIAMVLGGGQALLEKKLILTSNPVCLGGLLAVFVLIFFFIGALLSGDLTKIGKVSFLTNVILFGSGVYGSLLGIGLGFVYVKIFGFSRVSLVSLSAPIFTGIFAYLFLRESLNALQIPFAIILIGGCFFAVRKQSKDFK